jgi:hypothetical protein
MAKIQSMVFTVLVSLCLAAGTFAATEPSNLQGSAYACASCHANFSSVLPKGHVEVKESGLAASVATP